MRTLHSKVFASAVLYIGLFVAGIFGTAINAEAATLPAVCANTPVVQGFNPYVYDGELHSFDYVVVGDGVVNQTATVVGGHSLEPRFSTYWQTGAPQATRVHVDVPSWYGIAGEVHIVVNVMTALGTNCNAQKEFVVQLPASHVKPVAKPATPVQPAAPQAPTTTQKPVEKTKTTPTKDVVKDGAVPGVVTKGTVDIEKQCTSWPKMAWIFLALICIVAVFVIVDSLPYLLAGNGTRFAVTLLVMFLAMLALWFMFDRCREHRWFPIAVTLLTIGTLIVPTAIDKKGRMKKLL